MAADIRAILELEVPVIVRLAERMMTLEEVLSFVPGTIIELPKNAEDELDLMVNNRQVGLGSAVKVAENFGIRVTHLGDVKERIKAIASIAAPMMEKVGGGSDDLDALAEAMLSGQI